MTTPEDYQRRAVAERDAQAMRDHIDNAFARQIQILFEVYVHSCSSAGPGSVGDNDRKLSLERFKTALILARDCRRNALMISDTVSAAEPTQKRS